MINHVYRSLRFQTGFAKRIAVLLGLLLGAQVQATLLVNDTFSDGERLTENQPGSLHWVTGGPSSNVSVNSSTGMTFLDASKGQATAMAYFSPTVLELGQSITLSFNYSFQQIANGDNNFMFGLYNSGGSYATKDGMGFNNSIFNSYTGFAASGVFGSDPSGPGRDHIEARDKTGNNLLSIATYTEGQEYIQSGAATPGQIYTASLQISRTAAGMTVESRVGNTDIVQKFTTDLFTKFDTVGIFSNGNTGSFAIDNVQVNYSGLPEPSPCWAMACLGVLVFGRMAHHRILCFFPRASVSVTC